MRRFGSRKGQSALEFVMLSSILLVGIAVLIISAQSMLIDIAYDQDTKIVGVLVEAIKGELALADTQPIGYSRTFSLPLTFEGNSYGFVVTEESEPALDSITILYKQNTFFWFASQNLSGFIVPGQNTLVKSANGIRLN